MFLRKYQCLGKGLPKFLSIYLLWGSVIKWAGTVIRLHVLQCWDKTEENFRKPLVLYQCLTGALITLDKS